MMSRKPGKSYLVSVAATALIGGLIAPAPLAAQSTAAGEVADANGDQIVVTARKSRETIIRVPVAVTALSGSDIADRGIKNISDLANVAPGLRNQASSANRNDRSFNQLSFRGMWGPRANAQGSTVFLNGIAVTGGTIPGLTDVERVEVVNGPQSAYFGRSTFSGAINFVTSTPGFEPKARLDMSYASYDTRDLTASIELPIVDKKLSVRLSGFYSHTDGQYKNSGYSGRLGAQETKSISGTIFAQPIETLTIRAFHTSWKDSDGPSAQATLITPDFDCAANPARPTTINWICGTISKPPAGRYSFNNTRNSAFTTIDDGTIKPDFIDHFGLERKARMSNLLIDQEIGEFTLSAAFGLNKNDFAVLTDTYGQPPNGTGYTSMVLLYNLFDSKSAELRLASPTSNPLRVTVGANYYNEELTVQTRAFRPTPAAPNPAFAEITRPTLYETKTIGIFGALNYDISQAFALSLEGRYQWDESRQAVLIAGGADLSKTYPSFSPRAILSYHVDSSKELYVSYARGTKPGVFNAGLTTISQFGLDQIAAQADVPLAVPEEKLTSFEAGLKGLFFDRRLRILAAAYYGQWRDRQVSQSIPYRTSPTATSVINATLVLPGSSVNIYGLELQASLKVSDQLTIDGTFNYAETDIRSSSCVECVSIAGVLNNVGNRLTRYSPYAGTLSAIYEVPISGPWNGFSRSDYSYSSPQYVTEDNILKLGETHKVNLRVGARSDRYTVEMFVKNLFDSETASNMQQNTDPRTGTNNLVLAAPEKRSIGVRVAATF